MIASKAEARALAQAAIADRMDQGPFTAAELRAAGRVACGDGYIAWRVSRAAINAAKAAGRITLTGFGRSATWRSRP